MELSVAERLTAIIGTYELHGNHDAPVEHVSLDPLEPLFPKIERPMADWGIEGFVIPPQGEITESNPAVITLDWRLNRYHARLAYAHEIGHALHGHEGAFAMSRMDSWFSDRAERDAWTVAAMLLVPVDVVATYGERSRIAAVCGVPEWLIGLS